MAENPRWRLHATANPSEKSFSVTIPMVEIAAKIGEFDAFKNGAKFSGFPLIPDMALAAEERFGNYIYRECIETPGFSMQFMFVRTKTELERNTQFNPLNSTTTEEIAWLPVLNWISFTKNYGAPISQTTMDGSGRQGIVIIPRWVVLRSYIHGQTLTTTVKVREFLSEVPYPAFLMQSDEPKGTEIPWDLENNHGSTGRCLHDEKQVPGQAGSYSVISSNNNPESAIGTASPGQFVPKTNHLRWRDFITNSVRYENGQFHRIEKTYVAPRMPEASILS